MSRISADEEIEKNPGDRFKSVARLCCSAGKWQQSDIARLLDRQTQAALVRRANAGQTPGHDLAALGDELRQQANVFVIDRVDFLDTEFAHFFAAEKFPSARSAFTSTRTGWTPLSAVGIRSG
jgi:hypothetical protein